MADDQHPTVEQLQAALRALQEQHAVTLAENAELRQQQVAAADVLRVIAASPSDLDAVLLSLVAHAA